MWNHVEETARHVFGTFGFGEIRPPIIEPTELFARAVGAETDVSKEMYTFEDSPVELQRPRVEADFEPFLKIVEQLFEKRAIPQTDDNRVAIGDYKRYWEGYQEKVLEPYELAYAISAAHDIQLGPNVSLRPEATASVCRAYIEHNLQQLPLPQKLYYLGPMFRRERPQKGRYRQFYQIGAEVLGGSDAPAIDAEVIEMVMSFFDRLKLPGVHLDINSIGHAADNCR
ncbi:MAG TPA: ATP phosphoribosyltransferase regulatory subunit, partial [Candidatus Acidoferrum sp.]|nr:ATP phosphoribosyltransferase regulatory subunit [Candidatus Acidoferrum sp.]